MGKKKKKWYREGLERKGALVVEKRVVQSREKAEDCHRSPKRTKSKKGGKGERKWDQST